MSDDDFGTASSANSTIREFGVALGVAGLTAVFLGNGGELTPDRLHRRDRPRPAGRRGRPSLVAVVAALFAPGRVRR